MNHLKDTNGVAVYEGEKLFMYDWDGITKIYGTLHRSEPDKFYPWYVDWEDGVSGYVVGLNPIWKATEGEINEVVIEPREDV